MGNEIWVKSTLCDYCYVSTFGNVITVDRNVKYSNGRIHFYHGRILKPCLSGRYPTVSLVIPGQGRTTLIHRLIAEAFIPNPENKPQINHKNGIKTDNRVENLEWATQEENTQHAYDTKLLIKPSGKQSNLFGRKGKDCVNSKIILNTQTGIYYYSAFEAADSINIRPKSLRDRLTGVIKNKTPFIYV